MKSKLLLAGISDPVYRGIATFADTPLTALQNASVILDSAAVADRMPEGEAFYPIAEASNITVTALVEGLQAALYILDRARDYGDSIDQIAADLAETGKVRDSADLLVRLRIFDEQLQKRLEFFFKRKQAISSAFVTLSAMRTRVAMAYTFSNEFNPRKDRADNYEPQVETSVPAALVRLELDDFGEKSHFSFACSLEDLSEMIDHLELARKQLLQVAALDRDSSKGIIS
jgi:hypothetical protein